MSVGVQSRGPKCANLVNGSCGFAGGRCIDGAALPGCASPFHCNFFKSRGKQTAMKIRWAKHRRGEDNGAKLGRARINF